MSTLKCIIYVVHDSFLINDSPGHLVLLWPEQTLLVFSSSISSASSILIFFVAR